VLSTYINYGYIKSDSFTARADASRDIDEYEDDAYENKSFNLKVSYSFSDNDELSIKYSKMDADIDYDKFLSDQNGYTIFRDNSIFKASYTHKYLENNYISFYYSKADFNTKDPK